MDDSVIAEAQHMRDNAARAERDAMKSHPGSNSDWFLRGDIETLEANVTKITNPVDQGRIRTKIAHLIKESVQYVKRQIS